MDFGTHNPQTSSLRRLRSGIRPMGACWYSVNSDQMLGAPGQHNTADLTGVAAHDACPKQHARRLHSSPATTGDPTRRPSTRGDYADACQSNVDRRTRGSLSDSPRRRQRASPTVSQRKSARGYVVPRRWLTRRMFRPDHRMDWCPRCPHK